MLGLIARIGARVAVRGAARVGARGAARAAVQGAERGVVRGAARNTARRAAARARLRRMRAKKIAREVLEEGLEYMLSGGSGGAGGGGGPRGAGAGRLLRSMGYNPGAEGFDFNQPPLDRPRRVSSISNPTISSIDRQLREIAKTVAELGVLAKQQQDELLKEAIQAEATAKEQQLEQPDATAVSSPGVGESIGPADSAIEQLIQAITGLTGIVEQKIQEAQQGGQGQGPDIDLPSRRRRGRGIGGRGPTKPRLRRGFRALEGGGYQNVKTGKFAAADDALKNFKSVDPSFLGKAARGRQAAAVAGKTSGRVAGVLGGALAKSKAGVGAATKIGKDVIAKVAKPLIAKSLAKTGLKSIPIVGAVAGGLFAIGRLLQGDVVGAGLEAASGLGGPLTAIPALVLSLARDVYSGVFGVQPETDPLVGQRMTLVKDTVEELAKEALGQKVTKQGAAGAATPQTTAPAIPAPPAAPAAGSGAGAQPAATPVSAPPPTSTAAAPASSGAGSGSAPSSGAPPASAPAPEASASGGSPQQVADQMSQSKLEGEEGAPPPASGATPAVKTETGEKILQASTEPPPTAAGMGMTGSAPPKPATLPTTKGRAKGMGDVPEPTYLNIGSIANQLYFGSVAGVMAS